MTDILVQADGISKEYQRRGGETVRALSDATCRIEAGQRIAVVGASGSGKSTLLHLLGGLIAPTSGQITWPALGERAGLQPTKVQFAFQSASLFPALTVLRNVALPLVLAGRPDGANDKAIVMLDHFGLGDLAQKLPEELSGGQAQRVAMVRALTMMPRLILADEPTGQLDSPTARTFLDAVLQQAEGQGAGIVIATHDPAVAARMDLHWSIERGHLKTASVGEAAI